MRINGERLLARLNELASAGQTRLAITDEDKAGRDLVTTWMTDLGLDVSVDGIGNVVAVLAGSEDVAPVMCGSHIDTVRGGGRYDGNLGVLAGIEVIESVIEARITPRRPLAVAFFTDEEGSRFPPDMLGSLVYVGGMALEQALDLTDVDGATVGAELERIGYRGPAPCPGVVPHAFVELHIEQGPVLEHEQVTIGAVTGVQGISWQEISLQGQANHAGTTPMHLRTDPGVAAAELTVFVNELANAIPGQVGTVGSLRLHPDLVNVIPGSATLTVDLRNTDEQALQQAEAELAERIGLLGIPASTRPLARFEPVEFAPEVVDLVERTARDLGHSVMRMPSGAGHDAQMLARVCPTGMVFVPSRDGISHNPAEHTEPEQLTAGGDVLASVMLELSA